MRLARAARIGLTIALSSAAAGVAEELVVPRGVAVVVDGVLEPEIWSDARVEATADGLELRLQHDGRDLYLVVAAPRPGFASLCLATGPERSRAVEVLHASAALGQVRYERRRDAWATRAREFDFGMRETDSSALARTARRRYLEEHGWVASTFQMGRGAGPGSVQELHLDGEHLGDDAALALAFRLEDGTILRWPDGLAATDGCADPELVRGGVPERLLFAPESWARIVFAP
jgi:hypothetical protein